jgi:hypothetical protein
MITRFGAPIAAVATAMVIGCGSKAAPPVATETNHDAAPPVAEAQVTMATATLSVTGMH